DHSALELKNEIIPYLKELGHEVKDYGTFSKESCDYTDFGIKAAEDVRDGLVERAILICYTGIGMSIIANKVKGVRCALVHFVEEAVLTREHNDSNCLALSAKYTSISEAKEIVRTWLDTSFSFGERHTRRVEKINKYEEEHL
ncbi:MAG: RpiB/LacA/LacB family sugar-phosphate isomerase, partial [Anaeroplasmataceae bacterium]|nr:RpiB/LacA/LacB family sugar-phosphate isomerase [Anaeroplasmataceae bacterium]